VSRPYLTTRRWVREKFAEWGRGHPLWESKVLGNFPTQADNALISLAWIEAAARRVPTTPGAELTAGLDVAGPGEDETVLVVADGPTVVAVRAWTMADPRGEVVAALAPYKDRLVRVNVDSAGIGYYLGMHLEDLDYPVGLVNVGQAPSDPPKYANLKAEFYWQLRMRFQDGDVAGIRDERTIGQLAGILYRHDARGRITIESKEDARKRGVKSPDRAEAVMLAFASSALGWRMVSDDDDFAEGDRPTRPLMQQLQAVLPFELPSDLEETLGTCSDCLHFQATDGDSGRCTLRRLLTNAREIACGELLA